MPGPDVYGELRELSHERVYQLWQIAKRGGQLEGDDARLAQTRPPAAALSPHAQIIFCAYALSDPLLGGRERT